MEEKKINNKEFNKKHPNKKQIVEEKLEEAFDIEKELQKRNRENLELTKKIEEQKSSIEELKELVNNYKNTALEATNKMKYHQAELVNYRKRKDEEVSELLKYSNTDIVKELLPTIDNLERAIKASTKEESELVKKYMEGVILTYNNLMATLNKFEVNQIERTGQKFDPNLETALVADHNEELEDEVVIETLQKGYMLKDRVIRPASVRVNNL